MAHLKITITATVPLPKNAGAAVAETIKAHEIMREAAVKMAKDGIYPDVAKLEQYADDEAIEPAAPKPPRKKRRTRAEMEAARPEVSSTVKVTPADLEALRGAGQLSTTGADGEDLLHIPDNLRRA